MLPQDDLEDLSIRDGGHVEEEIAFLSAESNGDFGVDDSLLAIQISEPADILLFAHYVDQIYLI